jgi:hypothetical protein
MLPIQRLLFVALTLSAPLALNAQSTTLTLEGVVTGSDGALHGARVEVRNRENGALREALTDVRGAYHILSLDPASYDVTVRALGYRPQRRIDVPLVAGEASRLDVTLEHGAVELEPTIVTGILPIVERTDVSTPVVQKEMERLPLNARDALKLSSIAPGIRSFALEGGSGKPTAGALTSARFVNLYVDGVEWKGLNQGALLGHPEAGTLLPQEAIQEYRVSLMPYDVELTNGMSWVMSAVTHQGSNKLAGSLFGFEQSRDFVARASFQATKPEYKRAQFGGSLRGPIVHDRLFFSGAFEAQNADNFLRVVPGRPNANPGVWDRYAGSFRAPSRNQMGLLRLTWRQGAHTFDAIGLSRNLAVESGIGSTANLTVASRDAAAVNTYRIQTLQLRDRYASSSFVNELSVHMIDSYENDGPLVPGVTMKYPGIQTGRFTLSVTNSNRLGLADKITRTIDSFVGKHLLKAGAQLMYNGGNSWAPSFKDGFFRFATDTSTLPNLGQIGIGYTDSASTSDAWASTDVWLASTYLQDQWRPVQRLMLTLGFRSDGDWNAQFQRDVAPWANDTVLQRVVTSRYLNSGDRENHVTYSPRAAIAWDVFGSGRTSLRAGYGTMYEHVPVAGALDEKLKWEWRIYSIANPGTTDPAKLRSMALATGGPAPNITLLPDRLRTASNHQWSVGVGHRLTDRVVINADYVDQHMVNLPVTVRINSAVAGKRSLTNRYGDILLWGDFGDARFSGLLTSLTFDRAPTRLNVAYTLSWAESEFGDFSTSDFRDSSFYVMQRSEGDERHRVVLSGFTDGPLGLQLAAITIVASPRPFSAIAGTDVNKSGGTEDDWINGSRTWRPNGALWPSLNSGWGNWYKTVDLRVARPFAFGGGHLVATFDVFNLANSANHSDYQQRMDLQGFGMATGDYARRQVQIGTRYQF